MKAIRNFGGLAALFQIVGLLMAPMTASCFVVTRPSSREPQRRQLVDLNLQSSSWQSHVSTHPNASKALADILDEVLLGSAMDTPNLDTDTAPSPHLAFLFVGPTHAVQFEALVKQASAALQPVNCRLLSVVGGGVVGGTIECDEPSKPSISLLAGRIPSIIEPVVSSSGSLKKNEGKKKKKKIENLLPVNFFSFNELTNRPPPPESEYWEILADGGCASDSKSASKHRSASYILFADPWSPLEDILEGLSSTTDASSSVIVGGVSVPTTARPTVALDDQALPQGSAVGVAFSGAGGLGIQAVVTQGCRPLGPVYTVTAVQHNNCILELDSKPALQTLEALFASQKKASVQEQRQMGSRLVCGILLAGSTDKRGSVGSSSNDEDYLIRQIRGYVPSKSGIAIAGSRLQVGDQIRFHVRDQTAARDDLHLMVQRAKTERLFYQPQVSSRSTASSPSPRILAALQISCVARGRSLFGTPHVDLSSIQDLATTTSGDDGDENDDDGTFVAPIAGFFANGEIGPVGVAGFSAAAASNKNNRGTRTTTTTAHLHGFTTVAALLCDYSAADAAKLAASSASLDDASFLDDEPIVAWE